MSSINCKLTINNILENNEVIKLLDKCKNSDIFRYEFMNQEFHDYYRIKKCFLNSLYFKLLAAKKNSNVKLNQVT